MSSYEVVYGRSQVGELGKVVVGLGGAGSCSHSHTAPCYRTKPTFRGSALKPLGSIPFPFPLLPRRAVNDWLPTGWAYNSRLWFEVLQAYISPTYLPDA